MVFIATQERKNGQLSRPYRKNVWCDQGDGIGGTIIDLAIEILKSHGKPCTVSDALDWIENTDQLWSRLNIVPVENYIEEEPKLHLTRISDIQHSALKNYLHFRGIPLHVAALDMKEAKVYNRITKKHFFALAMKNEEDGYELRNQIFKGCVGAKDITFIRGINPSGIHLFEGSFDYETMLTINKGKPFRNDTIILHSVSNVDQAISLIKGFNYEFALTWMDNDKAGRKARLLLNEFCKTESGLLHKPMNKMYAP